MRERLDPEALTFAVLRGLTMIGGFVALSIVPLRPEHQVHLGPLLGAFIVYKGALFALLFLRPERARAIFLATLGSDVGIVFVLVWFTGGGESHFYLLFLLLVALNAYHFGPGVGVLAAGLSAGLMALANLLVVLPAPWSHIGARAVLNLVKNGMEATPRGGGVCVATRLDRQWVEVTVADTGSGIEARHAPHLFEPFFSTKPRGAGLGLAIARQITEEHEGTLTWDNHPDGGARFTLRLPLKGAAP